MRLVAVRLHGNARLARHAARGLPELAFREAYTRYAKSLVAVGAGKGSDARVGLKIEVVAGANPYTDDLSGAMPVQVFYLDRGTRDGLPFLDVDAGCLVLGHGYCLPC